MSAIRVGRPGGAGAALLVAFILVGCDIPTGLPSWETEWSFSGEEIRISVADLLPGEVSVVADGSAFQLDPFGLDVQSRLRDHCPECAIAHGLRIPKPAFELGHAFSISLPPEIVEVSVVSGWVDFRVRHAFGFDPIRPGLGRTGVLTMRIGEPAGPPLVQLVRDGADLGFPSGVMIEDSLPLTGATLRGEVPGTVHLASPLGEPTTIDADAVFAASTMFRDLFIDRIRVRPGERTFSLDDVIDVGELSADLVERMNGGRLSLRIQNPFGAAFLLALTIMGGDGSEFERSLRVPEGAGELEMTFSGPEIRSLLSSGTIRLRGTGQAEDPASEVELRPEQTLELDSVIRVRIHAGESP